MHYLEISFPNPDLPYLFPGTELMGIETILDSNRLLLLMLRTVILIIMILLLNSSHSSLFNLEYTRNPFV